jgi:hypothetical protein
LAGWNGKSPSCMSRPAVTRIERRLDLAEASALNSEP